LDQLSLPDLLGRKRKYVATAFLILSVILNFYYNNLQNFTFQGFLTYYIWVLPGGHLAIFVIARRLVLNDYALIIPALVSFNLISGTIVFIGKTVL
jgi:hypothetical protein